MSGKHDLMQCQICHKSKVDDGITLSICSGCKSQSYCSKGCQKAAWPAHKAECRERQATRKAMDQTLANTLDSLRQFTNAHRQVIAECAMRALALWRDITIADREAFMVSVRRRPGAKRTRESWIVESAEVVAFDQFPAANVAGTKARLHLMRESAAAAGEPETGSFCIMVMDVETKACNTAVISFPPEEVRLYKASPQWRAQLFATLNGRL